jgi:hypothetical protein
VEGLRKEKIKIYPLLGVGGGGYGISIARNEDVLVSNIVANPGREINVNRGGFVLDGSININVVALIQFDEKENAYGGFMTGIKIGYVYGFPSSNWNFAGGDVTDGPNFGINMFYIKLIIGGFGYSAEKK